ncbi:MAG: [FeFe] hydrogenase H-cluster radical SAM maturase HydE [Bacteroidetes bacterium GWA2_30_7]|nr:MAG: [FeFe] hydrogenase H-cluster radical SAM maturase HydE [Bacteroidetes bacterium GWA2_30_7]
MITEILSKENFTIEDIIKLLNSSKDEQTELFEKSAEIKKKYLGNYVYLRGLIEFSNVCIKNCYYCGIRKDNSKVSRYNISDNEILEAAKYAYENNYGSLVLQSGEVQNRVFSDRIEKLVKQIKSLSDNKLGITLSCGEQSKETYLQWFNAGAHRYLLRIETANKELYKKLHPIDDFHDWDKRLDCLKDLKEIGYQTGTGIMVGLPFQTIDDLANDLIFMKNMDIDMCGMGPYIEHFDTPLYQFSKDLMTLKQRLNLTLKMIAILRILMKDINIVATTALQAIDKIGREKAIRIGANILMPNITPISFRDKYLLYENKPCINENSSDCKNCIDARMKIAGNTIEYGKWGDSLHFQNSIKM